MNPVYNDDEKILKLKVDISILWLCCVFYIQNVSKTCLYTQRWMHYMLSFSSSPVSVPWKFWTINFCLKSLVTFKEVS